MEKVKVGVHVGIQPTYGESNMWEQTLVLIPPTEPTMHISQVFCAAMNLRQGEFGYRNSVLERASRKPELLLEAAYRGTYLAAIRHGCPKLFLTLIGGGAFGNDSRLIFDVIKKVHLDIACKDSNTVLKEVHIVLFSQANGMIEFLKDLQSRHVNVAIYAYKGNSGTIYTLF